jgi:hypothetical protein
MFTHTEFNENLLIVSKVTGWGSRHTDISIARKIGYQLQRYTTKMISVLTSKNVSYQQTDVSMGLENI